MRLERFAAAARALLGSFSSIGGRSGGAQRGLVVIGRSLRTLPRRRPRWRDLHEAERLRRRRRRRVLVVRVRGPPVGSRDHGRGRSCSSPSILDRESVPHQGETKVRPRRASSSTYYAAASLGAGRRRAPHAALVLLHRALADEVRPRAHGPQMMNRRRTFNGTNTAYMYRSVKTAQATLIQHKLPTHAPEKCRPARRRSAPPTAHTARDHPLSRWNPPPCPPPTRRIAPSPARSSHWRRRRLGRAFVTDEGPEILRKYVDDDGLVGDDYVQKNWPGLICTGTTTTTTTGRHDR